MKGFTPNLTSSYVLHYGPNRPVSRMTVLGREHRFAQAINKCINMTAIMNDVDRHQACDLTFE
jgi:hypothetical protein